MTIWDLLSKNPYLIWSLFIATVFLCVLIVISIYSFVKIVVKNRWSIQIFPPKLIPPSNEVNENTDNQSLAPDKVISQAFGNSDYERELKKIEFPDPLKRLLASNLAGQVSSRLDNPDILLAVQKGGQWLAEELAKWLTKEPKIILVEKDIPKDRVGACLKIPSMGLEERPNLFIVHNELDQKSGKMVMIEDYIKTGETVRSIVNALKTRNNHVEIVAAIGVTETCLDKLQRDLRRSSVKLEYLLTMKE